MLILLFILFICLFAALIFFVSRRITRSEMVDSINQSIYLSAGIPPKK